MIRYFRVTADYNPNNPKKATYDFKISGDFQNIKDSKIKSELKKYFNDLIPWLKVYGVEEITEQECSKWIFRKLKIRDNKKK